MLRKIIFESAQCTAVWHIICNSVLKDKFSLRSTGKWTIQLVLLGTQRGLTLSVCDITHSSMPLHKEFLKKCCGVKVDPCHQSSLGPQRSTCSLVPERLNWYLKTLPTTVTQQIHLISPPTNSLLITIITPLIILKTLTTFSAILFDFIITLS